MKKKIVILNLILIIFQVLYPVLGNAFLEEKEVKSYSAKMEYKKAENTFFNKNINFKWEVFPEDEYEDLPQYGLLTPSNADSKKSIPLILSLHGTGHYGMNKNQVDSGFPAAIYNSKYDNFCSYVLCPSFRMEEQQLWTDSDITEQVRNLLEYFIANYNVDRNNIVIVGHSGGGPGAFYYADPDVMGNYFSKAVIFSSDASGTSSYWYHSKVKIPTLCFAGNSDEEWARRALTDYFAPTFGYSNCFFVNSSHGSVPHEVFQIDSGYFQGLDDEEYEIGIERK